MRISYAFEPNWVPRDPHEASRSGENCLRSRVIGMFPAPRRAKTALKSIGQSEPAHRLLIPGYYPTARAVAESSTGTFPTFSVSENIRISLSKRDDAR
jgi:hypothetical protein